MRTLPQALADAARTSCGYVFVDGPDERSCSYADLRRASLAQAGNFAALGLRPGDFVALVLNDQQQFLTAFLAASLAGLVPVSLFPPSGIVDRPRFLETTAVTLNTACARALVTSGSLAADFEAVRAQCPELQAVLVVDAPGLSSSDSVQSNADEPRVDPDDLAFVQFTSGSTARPKGIPVSHRSLSANIEAINGPSGLNATESDSAASWLPLYHDMGLVGMALGALYRGRPAVLLTPSTFVKRPVEWLRAISRHRATISFAPNFAYDLCVRRIKDRDLRDLDLSCWRVAGCGAEPIQAATLAAFAARFRAAGFFDTSFMPSYGLAEHVLAATLTPPGRGVRTDRRSGVELVSCGFPLPGHRLSIVDDNDCAVPDGTTGEIVLAGPSVMRAYHGRTDDGRDIVLNGWLRTGDLGYMADGELFVCGRSKETIIVNGRKHHPQDLEWAIADLAGLRRGRAVAFGVPQGALVDRLVVVVEAIGAVDGDQLRHEIRHRISQAFALYVDEVVVVPSGSISRTTSGKVQRAALRQRYVAGELS